MITSLHKNRMDRPEQSRDQTTMRFDQPSPASVQAEPSSSSSSPAQAMFDRSGRVQSQIAIQRALNDGPKIAVQTKLADMLSSRGVVQQPTQPASLTQDSSGGSTPVAQLAKRNESKKKKGGARNTKHGLDAALKAARALRKPPTKRTRYLAGTHGYKKNEQRRLRNLLGITVSGSSHESEHTIGFEPINQRSGFKRGTNRRVRVLENLAPAYQEVKASHRQHIGTGTRMTPDASGFNSLSYRQTQRALLESGDISSAVQINQLGYAFDPNFSTAASTRGGRAARDSYYSMIENLSSVEYATGPQTNARVDIDATQRAEMYLARLAAETGEWPSAQQIADAKLKFGVK